MRQKAIRLRLISVVGVPLTLVIFKGNRSRSLQREIIFSSSLKGTTKEKIQ